MSRYIAERCSAHIRATSGSCVARERRALQHVDGHHRVAAPAQVDQRQREFGVEQRGERDDDRPRRDRRTRRQCACGGLEFVAGAEYGVEHPVELALPDVGAEPSGPAAAERDDAGPVTVAQRGLHHLRGAAHDALGGFGRGAGGLGIAVDQHHDVGGAVGQPLGHVQAAAARADRPVDGAQLVTRHVGADVGVLDARPDVPGQMRAEPVEQLGPRDRRRLRRRHRKDGHLGGVDDRPSRQQAAVRDDIDRGRGPGNAPSARR